MKRIFSLLLAAFLLGCGSDGDKADNKPAEIYPVSWNITDATMPSIVTLADLGHTVVFFSEAAAIVMTDGQVTGESGPDGPFHGATVIPAADQSGQWIVALNKEGHVVRVLLHDATLEDVSARYGLETTEVRAVAAMGATEAVAFLLADGIAVADGQKVRHWSIGPAKSIAASDKRIALIGDDGVRVFDVASSSVVMYPVTGARAAAFAADGRLVVAAGPGLYREDGGRLDEIHHASEGEVHSLVTAGKHVWFADAADLGVINEQGTLVVSRRTAYGVTTLTPSQTGDVWALASGTVLRFAATGATSGAASSWEEQIKPIFDGNCSQCHLPNGLAAIDLSTYERWNVMRSTLMKRVVVEQNMPPTNSKALSDPDREKIRQWLTGQLE